MMYYLIMTPRQSDGFVKLRIQHNYETFTKLVVYILAGVFILCIGFCIFAIFRSGYDKFAGDSDSESDDGVQTRPEVVKVTKQYAKFEDE